MFTQNTSSEFENLKKRLRSQHQDCIQKVYQYVRGSAPRGMMDNWLETSTNEAKSIYEWIDWIVVNNLPFSFCGKETTRRKSKLTFKKKHFEEIHGTIVG